MIKILDICQRRRGCLSKSICVMIDLAITSKPHCVSGVIILIVILFSISAFLMIFGSMLSPYTFALTEVGKYTMLAGFAALAIGIFWLMYTLRRLAKYEG